MQFVDVLDMDGSLFLSNTRGTTGGMDGRGRGGTTPPHGWLVDSIRWEVDGRLDEICYV